MTAVYVQWESHCWRLPRDGDDALHCERRSYRIQFDYIDSKRQGKLVYEYA